MGPVLYAVGVIGSTAKQLHETAGRLRYRQRQQSHVYRLQWDSAEYEELQRRRMYVLLLPPSWVVC